MKQLRLTIDQADPCWTVELALAVDAYLRELTSEELRELEEQGGLRVGYTWT